MNAKSLSWAVAGAAVLAAVLAVGASGAGGRFVEPDVQVLHQFDGAGPAGLGLLRLGGQRAGRRRRRPRQRRDRRRGVQRADAATGTTYVYSGRTGPPASTASTARPATTIGFSIADAGDTERRPRARHPRRLARERARPRRPLLRPHRRPAPPVRRARGNGDAFGWSVSSAGDVDRDHRADVLIGAPQSFGAVGPGYAVVYSGRTYQPIRTLTGDASGDRSAPARAGPATSTTTGSPTRSSARRTRGRPARRGVRLLRQDRAAPLHDPGVAARRHVRLVLRRGRRRREPGRHAGRLRGRLRRHHERRRRAGQPVRAGRRLLRPRRARAAALARRGRARASARAAGPATSTTTAGPTSSSARTRRARARRRPARCRSSRAGTARSCARSRARPRASSSASTPSASGT